MTFTLQPRPTAVCFLSPERCGLNCMHLRLTEQPDFSVRFSCALFKILLSNTHEYVSRTGSCRKGDAVK
jgi:hypothetical protein